MNLQILFLNCLQVRLSVIYKLVFSLSVFSCRRLQFDNVSSVVKARVRLSLDKIMIEVVLSFDFAWKVGVNSLEVQKELIIVVLKFIVSVFGIWRCVSLVISCCVLLLSLVFLNNGRPCVLEFLFEESWVRSLSCWFIQKRESLFRDCSWSCVVEFRILVLNSHKGRLLV